MQWNNHNHSSTWRQNYFYRTTECLYGFPHPQAEPSRTPTMPCDPAAFMKHPLLVVTGSIQCYNCGTQQCQTPMLSSTRYSCCWRKKREIDLPRQTPHRGQMSSAQQDGFWSISGVLYELRMTTENEDFLYEAPSYRHMLVANNTPGDLVEFYQVRKVPLFFFSTFSFRRQNDRLPRQTRDKNQY